MTSASEGGTVSFARPIRPLFRAKDRHSMRPVFHLFDYFNVANHADAIAGAGEREDTGRRRVACIGRADISRWIDTGKHA